MVTYPASIPNYENYRHPNLMHYQTKILCIKYETHFTWRYLIKKNNLLRLIRSMPIAVQTLCRSTWSNRNKEMTSDVSLCLGTIIGNYGWTF